MDLNFYPPSSTSRADFWVATTDGAKLYTNALVWAAEGATPPPAAPTLTAPANAATDVSLAPTLDWDPPTTGSAPTTYSVEVRVGNSTGAPVLGSPFTVNAPTTEKGLAGLTPLTTYYWSVKSVNSSGSSSAVSRASATVPAPPTVATAAATSVTGTSATLNGTVNPNSGATTYVFRYGTTPGLSGTTTTVPVSPGVAGAGSSATPVTFPLTGLAISTTYYYRVEATNAGGTTSGNIVAFATHTPPSVTAAAQGGSQPPRRPSLGQ